MEFYTGKFYKLLCHGFELCMAMTELLSYIHDCWRSRFLRSCHSLSRNKKPRNICQPKVNLLSHNIRRFDPILTEINPVQILTTAQNLIIPQRRPFKSTTSVRLRTRPNPNGEESSSQPHNSPTLHPVLVNPVHSLTAVQHYILS